MSTEPNLRMLFDQYHSGFDNYGAWYEHHKAMHANHPLDCAEFGAEWLRRWSEVGRLLQTNGRQEFYGDNAEWVGWPAGHYKAPTNTARALVDSIERLAQPSNVRGFAGIRVVLLDGTIVHEWPTKDEYDDIF